MPASFNIEIKQHLAFAKNVILEFRLAETIVEEVSKIERRANCVNVTLLLNASALPPSGRTQAFFPLRPRSGNRAGFEAQRHPVGALE
jgi:hypothetical protein